MIESIFAAAIKSPNGVVYSWSAPRRHHDVLQFMRDLGVSVEDICNSVQGFITIKGRFVDRKEAYEIASCAGQLIAHEDYSRNSRLLYSEQVW